MQRAIKGQEQVTFVRAENQFSAQPGDSGSIADMMRLACEGNEPSIVKRASDWLFRNVGVQIVRPEGAHLSLVSSTGL